MKTKIISILVSVCLLMSFMPFTIMALDFSHVCEDESLHCTHDITSEIDVSNIDSTSIESRGLLCELFGHAIVKDTVQVPTGGKGYEYCSSTTTYEKLSCVDCTYSDLGDIVSVVYYPHQWSVGWCGQTCTDCGVIQYFHAPGGCSHCD